MAGNSAQRRTERLLNLVVYLLDSPRGVNRAAIRSSIEDYRVSPSNEAFERMFERDKRDLRDLGIPLLTVENPSGAGDNASYSIDQSQYELPEIVLTPQERAVLVVAARAWEQGCLHSAAAQGLRKLGVATTSQSLPPVATNIGANDATFEAVYQAVHDRRSISFAYRNSGAATAAARQVDPYVLVSHKGAWYVIGKDAQRDDTRVFRLSRIMGSVEFAGEAGSAQTPPVTLVQMDISALIEPEQDLFSAVLRVRAGAGNAIRRIAHTVSHVDENWDRIWVREVDFDRFVSQVCGFGPDVVLEEPADMRAAVIEALTTAAKAHR